MYFPLCSFAVWDISKFPNDTIFTGHQDSIIEILSLHSGRSALTVSRDKTLRLWNLSNGTCQGVLEKHQSQIVSVKILEDEKIAISTDSSNIICFWNLNRKTAIESFQMDLPLSYSFCNFRKKYLIISLKNQSFIYIIK